ncbi:MAG: hypothetical protein JWR09_5286 [Mucilaginibacter sp.]|nr:hypothetical protein [Mucilaginibacter sp.]
MLLIAVTIISWQGKPAQSYAPLTDADRKNYVISIDQQELRPPQMSNPGVATTRYYMNVDLRITNNSNDTLKYLSMWCSWSDILKTDNPKLHISGNYCSSDHPEVKMVLPHRADTYKLFVVLKKEAVVAGTPFKVGMSIYKFKSRQQLKGFNSGNSSFKDNTDNLIWSNTVQIPK